MQIFTISNQKGGVGKSSLSRHFTDFLSTRGRTLAVDLDPQGNLTDYLVGHLLTGDDFPEDSHIMQLFKEQHPAPVVVSETLHLVGSDIRLSEFDAVSGPKHYTALKRFVKTLDYDYIVFDTPPNLGIFQINALFAAQHVLCPLDSSRDSYLGLKALMKTCTEITEEFNPALSMLGFILNCYDARTKADARIKERVTEDYPGLLFNTEIPRTTTIRDARENNKTIWELAPNHKVGVAYKKLFNEIITKMENENE